MASSSTRADDADDTATFQLGPTTRVITEDGRDVARGTGETGKVAMRGYTPIGYYKDPEKSAATFHVIEGVRYSIPGDFATVDADGTVHLLGRRSQCINTGGEKVFPEEVEEVLKRHPNVIDAAVVGLPDERFGEAIHALVEPRDEGPVDADALIEHVKAHLAAYKAPKRIVRVDTIGRAANGKLDYRALRDRAITEAK
jgi:acyl-CoA synthetase (AMP-forming)/AMP-acid ligase II